MGRFRKFLIDRVSLPKKLHSWLAGRQLAEEMQEGLLHEKAIGIFNEAQLSTPSAQERDWPMNKAEIREFKENAREKERKKNDPVESRRIAAEMTIQEIKRRLAKNSK